MKTKILNSKFNYLLDDEKTIVNVKKTSIKHLMISALQGGSDGLSNVNCLVTGEKLFLIASQKLARKYNPHYVNSEEYTEKEIINEDRLIQAFTREQVISILEQLLDRPDLLMDAINNENTIYDAETLLDKAEYYISEIPIQNNIDRPEFPKNRL